MHKFKWFQVLNTSIQQFIDSWAVKRLQVILSNNDNSIFANTHTLKQFQLFLFNTNNFIECYLFVCTQFNDSSLTLTISFKVTNFSI